MTRSFLEASGGTPGRGILVVPPVRNGEIVGAVITFTDNTERRKSQAHINYLTYHDSLTGLYNKGVLRRGTEEAEQGGEEACPLDYLRGSERPGKLTNDVFGHAAGDELLKKAAEALRKSCREATSSPGWEETSSHHSAPHNGGNCRKNHRQDQGKSSRRSASMPSRQALPWAMR